MFKCCLCGLGIDGDRAELGYIYRKAQVNGVIFHSKPVCLNCMTQLAYETANIDEFIEESKDLPDCLVCEGKVLDENHFDLHSKEAARVSKAAERAVKKGTPIKVNCLCGGTIIVKEDLAYCENCSRIWWR